MSVRRYRFPVPDAMTLRYRDQRTTGNTINAVVERDQIFVMDFHAQLSDEEARTFKSAGVAIVEDPKP